MRHKHHLILFVITLFYWGLTLFTDTKIFTHDPLDMNCLPKDESMVTLMHLLTKVILFFVIFGLLEFLWYAKDHKALLFSFLGFSALYLVGLLVTYPGYFMSDDPIIFAYASRYYPVYWHNYLTSLFYMVGMSLIPASSGPVILSDLCYGLVYAYIYENTRKLYPSKWTHSVLFLGVLPFTLLGSLLCFRPALYAPFFLFLIAYLFFEWKKKAPLTLRKLCGIAFMSALLSIWRSEGIVLMVFIYFILGFVYLVPRPVLTDSDEEPSSGSKRRSGCVSAFFCERNLIVFTVFLLAFFCLIKLPQSHGEKKYYGNDYLIISTTRPLSVIVHRDQTYEGADEDLANISAVTEYGYLHNDSLSCSAYNRYNSDHNEGKYTETGADAATQKAYLKSAFRLIAHNLDLYLGERLQLFLVTNGIYDYDKNMVLNLKPVVTTDFHLYEHDRSYGFELIEGNKRLPLSTNNTYAMALYSYGGEAYIPMLLLLLILTLFTLVRKQYMVFFTCLMMLAREGVIFLTAPASFIQYSYPVMFATAFLVFMTVFETTAARATVKPDSAE